MKIIVLFIFYIVNLLDYKSFFGQNNKSVNAQGGVVKVSGDNSKLM